MGKRKHLNWKAHLFDTCLFTMSEEALLPVEEDETFCKVTCPSSSQTLALPVAQSHHQAAANWHPEEDLLPVGLT